MKATTLIATVMVATISIAVTPDAPSAHPTFDSAITLVGEPTSVICRGLGEPRFTVTGVYSGWIASNQPSLRGQATITLTAKLNELTGIGSGRGMLALTNEIGQSTLGAAVSGNVHGSASGQLFTMQGLINGHRPDGAAVSSTFHATFVPESSRMTAESSSLPLSARVIRRGEFPGFGPFGPGNTTLYRNAEQWVRLDRSLANTQASAQVARLHREHFTAALLEQLGSLHRNWGGVSWVMQLGSAAAARAELAANIHDWQATSKPPKTTYAAFPVTTTIPGARGYHLSGTASTFQGDNIVFTDGPYLYLVGDGWQTGTKLSTFSA